MNDRFEAKEMSFVDIFHKYGFEISIPSIQRDYAQGRNTVEAKKIRENFVRQLKEYILSGESHSLDFIYGSGENGSFVPLDGQQRLTTLWLLHIYVLCVNNKNQEDSLDDFKFTYQTRDSSKRFCHALLLSAKNVLNHKSLASRKVRPSELIRNEGWWFIAWDDDPTVYGMLNMLDEIDKVFFDVVDEAYERLFSAGSYPIVFEFLPLNGFHDIDDLYIKMNARGLPLTSFEIFKSKLIEDVERYLPNEEKLFKANIDVNWSDTLWAFRDADKSIDKFLQRIMIVLLANEGTVAGDGKTIDPASLDCLFEANDKKVTFAHNWYERKGVIFNSALLARLNSDLHLLLDPEVSPLTNSIDGYDTFWFDVSEAVRRWILKGWDVDNEANLSYSTRLKLHAFLKYRKAFADSSNEEFSEWMRVVHNLLEATPIDSSSDMARALRGIENMLASYGKWRDKMLGDSQGSDVSINEWVAKSMSFKPLFMNNDQWQEEVVKAQLRRNEEWKELIYKAEHHPYLRGQIGVTLWLTGVIPPATPFVDLTEIPPIGLYQSYITKAYPLFEKLGNAASEEVKNFLMVRAMLAQGDYMPWASSYRKNLYNRPNHRDYSWKSLFRITTSSTNGTALKCLKGILDNTCFSESDICRSLTTIMSQGEPTEFWRKAFLGECGVKLMEYAKQGFIAFDGENVLIYGSSQRNHYHAELKSRLLYECLCKQSHCSPEYVSVKSQEEDSHIDIKGFSICHWNSEWKVWKDGQYDQYEILQNEDEVLEYIGVPKTYML